MARLARGQRLAMVALDGKVALVTGASSGIGWETAVQLAAEGAAVAAGARRTERLAELREQVEGAGGRLLPVELDVADEQACGAAVQRTVDELGGLDVLVNNAGQMLLGPVGGADTEDWRRMVSVNLLGLMYCTHAALPHLLERGGHVVQMSSVAGRTTSPGTAVYNATKWGVNAFSEALRQEVTTKGVRVTLVEPGAVATELTDHITHDKARQNAEKFYSEMRALQSEDIARAVVYAVTQPDHVAINEVLVRPTDQQR